MLVSKGDQVRIIKVSQSDYRDGVRGDDTGIVLGKDGIHFINVQLDRTGQVHPLYIDQLRKVV